MGVSNNERARSLMGGRCGLGVVRGRGLPTVAHPKGFASVRTFDEWYAVAAVNQFPLRLIASRNGRPSPSSCSV